jgi:hypothetical protein
MPKLENRKSDEAILRQIKESEEDYLTLDKDRLVLFAVDFLESRRIEPTFDKIVVATFKLFPKKFSLIGFPEYPDGRTIYYCAYNHCTLTKKWLFGNVQSAFKITEKGRYFLDETRKMLQGKIKSTKVHETIPRRKEITFIAELKKTQAFRNYISDKKEEIRNYDVYEALKAQPNSKELALAHLQRYSDYANRIGDLQIVEFLKFIKTRLEGEKDA